MNVLEFNSVEDLTSLPVSYLLEVKKNMASYSECHKVTVKFGETGSGQRPNYEICSASGQKAAYNSANHEHDSRSRTFHDRNTSKAFTYDEVSEALAGRVLG